MSTIEERTVIHGIFSLDEFPIIAQLLFADNHAEPQERSI